MKVLTAYWTAEHAIATAADAAFPGPHGNFKQLSEDTPYRYMRTDPRFGVDGLDLFQAVLTPAIQAQYDQVVGVERAKVAARAREDAAARAEGERRMTQPAGAQNQPPMTQLQKEQQGIRRCVESGRSETECLTEGIGKSFSNMIGGFLPPGLTPPPIVGVRVVGTYPGPGKFSLAFSNDSVSITCADLVPQSLPYTTTMTTGGLRIAVEGTALPAPLTMRADGRLAGPAEADISGQVITGYQIRHPDLWRWPHRADLPRDLRATYAPLRDRHARRFVFDHAARVGERAPGCDARLRPRRIGQEDLGGVTDRASPQRRIRQSRGAGSGIPSRGGGRRMPRSVIMRQYVARLQGAQVVVDVQHGATPFTLTLGSDGRLTGSGTVKVDGRAMTGSNPNGGFTYVPRSATCPLGVLSLAQ